MIPDRARGYHPLSGGMSTNCTNTNHLETTAQSQEAYDKVDGRPWTVDTSRKHATKTASFNSTRLRKKGYSRRTIANSNTVLHNRRAIGATPLLRPDPFLGIVSDSPSLSQDMHMGLKMQCFNLQFPSRRERVCQDVANATPTSSTAAVYDNKRNVLHTACRERLPLRAIRKIIKVCPGAVEQIDDNLQTPLHVAVESGASRKLIEVLLNEHPDAMLKRDNQGRNPLHLLCKEACRMRANALDVIKKIVTVRPSTLEQLDDQNQTPLHVAAACGAPTDAVGYLFCEYKHAASIQDKQGRTPLHCLFCRKPSQQLAMEDRDAGLHWLASIEHENMRQLVLSICAAVPVAVIINDAWGRSPLEYAIVNKVNESVVLALQLKTGKAREKMEELYERRVRLKSMNASGSSMSRVTDCSHYVKFGETNVPGVVFVPNNRGVSTCSSLG